MNKERKLIIAGNWKMNKTVAEALALVDDLKRDLAKVKEVASQVGQAYALRIIPFWIRVNRDYYVRGTDNFVIAKRKAQTGNWDDAGKLWEKETSSGDRKIAGRACYNMAIISEINGDLDAAIKWAQRS